MSTILPIVGINQGPDRIGHSTIEDEEGLREREYDLSHLIVTNECNLSCTHCLTESGPDAKLPDELTTEEFRRVTALMNNMNIASIHVEGGEPLRRRDICDILAEFDTLNNITIVTNGTIPWRPDFDLFVSRGLDSVMFSMDNFARPEHAQYGGIIRRLERYREKGANVKIRTTINRGNFDFMEEMIQLGIQLDVGVVRFGAYKPLGFGAGENAQRWALQQRDYAPLFNEIERLIEKYGDQIVIKLSLPAATPAFIPGPRTYNIYDSIGDRPLKRYAKILTCYALKRRFTVWSNGEVGPCNEMHEQYRLGNIKNTPLHQILSNLEKYQECHGCNYGHLVISSDMKSHDME